MAPTIYGGPQYENRSWAKNTVTLRFDEDGYAEVDAADLPKLDIHLHREFRLVDEVVVADDSPVTDPVLADEDDDDVDPVGV